MVEYPGCDFPYQIMMLKSEDGNKTGRDYTWLIDRKYDYFIDALKKVKKVYTVKKLRGLVTYAFKKALSSVMGGKPCDVEFAMRSIRCTIATEYVMRLKECEILEVKEPPNPLQHLSDNTTKLRYADLEAGNEHKARERLVLKGLL